MRACSRILTAKPKFIYILQVPAQYILCRRPVRTHCAHSVRYICYIAATNFLVGRKFLMLRPANIYRAKFAEHHHQDAMRDDEDARRKYI